MSSTLNTLFNNKPTAKAAKATPIAKRNIDDNMKMFLHAHFTGTCLEVAKNTIFGNPGDMSLLLCQEAQCTLPCSSCQPFWNNPSPATAPLGFQPQGESATQRLKVYGPALCALPLTKEYRKHATAWLNDFADKRWALKDQASSRMCPSNMFWSANMTNLILNNFHLLHSIDSVCFLFFFFFFLSQKIFFVICANTQRGRNTKESLSLIVYLN